MMLEKRTGWLGTYFMLGLTLLAVGIIYWQLARRDLNRPRGVDPVVAAVGFGQAAEDLKGQPVDESVPPLPFTQRAMAKLDDITRGTIYAKDNEVLAVDQLLGEGIRARIYPDSSFASLLGYVSGIRIGVAGLEYTYNETLLGSNRLDAQLGGLVHYPLVGSDLVLTLDPVLQHQAEEALGNRAGAVVILDGTTGAVLALVSKPHFDPAQVLDPAYVNGLLACDGDPTCDAPFVNRATQALYPPGSTWKTVTLIAALDSGQVNPGTNFDFGEPIQGPEGSYYSYPVGGSEVIDPNHTESQLDLGMAYAKSANAAFAQIGDEMPADILLKYVGLLGFGEEGSRRFPLEIERSVSQVAEDPGRLETDDLLRAVTAIGQGEILVSPFDMARLVLAVLNQGNLPIPFIVDSVRVPTGGSTRGPLNGKTVNGVISPETANTVREMMIQVVESGSGGRAAVPGLVIGGKTGTAQVGGDADPHAWFIGFAQRENKSIVAAVLVENGGEGSLVAAPIFADLAYTALGE